MNEPNPLETQLRSWTLRRPSAELREKIFSEPPAEKPRRMHPLNWCAPAAIFAFSMLMMFSARPHSQANLGAAETNLFFASITMNSVTSLQSADSFQGDFALSKLDLNLEQNVWRTASFASTNRDQSHSSMDSLPSGKTNILTR